MQSGRSTSCIKTTTCLFAFRFIVADYASVWKQCIGFFNHFVGDKPAELRMQVPPLTTNFNGLHVSLTENHRKAVVQAPRHNGTNPINLKDLEFHPQRFLMLGLEPGIYSAVILVTSQFGGHALRSWLSAKTRGQGPRTFS
jgi:hypothetical protein